MPEWPLPLLRGWRHPDGTVGIRHHLLVIPSVICAAQAALTMAEGAPGAVAIEHQHGCSQLGGDAHLTEQVLTGLGTHPNVAGALVVSLGCETVQGVGLHRMIVRRGQRAEFVGIQQSGGTGAAVAAGRQALDRLRDAAAGDPQVAVGWPDLRVGVEAAWLGIPEPQARVFVEVIDRLLRAGSTVMQAVPTGRPDLERSFQDRILGIEGPKARETSTISYATPAVDRGVFLMGTPESRIAQKTGLAAGGAHIILSPLVGGLPAGCPVAPVVHVGIAPYARAFAADVDVLLDESPALGAAEAVLVALTGACREETALEAMGDFEMAIHRIGPTM
ncbi:MAG TPA: UxaA family hydrolase [bacterium]|nr:UxaA family hydrolase [bacterium]